MTKYMISKSENIEDIISYECFEVEDINQGSSSLANFYERVIFNSGGEKHDRFSRFFRINGNENSLKIFKDNSKGKPAYYLVKIE